MFMTKTIIGNLLHKYSTRLHPMEQRAMPAGIRGNLTIDADKCIACRICAIKCPTQCILVQPETGLWERETMACIYCGVCADVCPTGCITMTNVYRGPFTEPNFLRFQCKPKVSKKAKGGAALSPDASPEEKKAAVEAAVKAKQEENE